MLPGESKLVTIQLALFPRDVPQLLGSDITNFVLEFNNKLGNIFNTSPTILPIPPDAPAEIPRVMLKSEPIKYSCNIAKSRIDFFITINSTFNEVEIRTDYHQKIQAASNFLSDKEIKIIRIGYVATFEADLSSLKITAPRYIKQHFIADKKFKDPQELTVRYVHRVTYNSGIDTNIVASMNQKGSGLTLELNKLLIQFDINSIPERTQNLTAQQINEFSAQALSEIASLIQNFPAI